MMGNEATDILAHTITTRLVILSGNVDKLVEGSVGCGVNVSYYVGAFQRGISLTQILLPLRLCLLLDRIH
jgi:hypothetical protein